MGIKQFNKIINLYFLNENGEAHTVIKCPTKGRKPDIEISGELNAAGVLSAFNITVKNLYLDLTGKQYSGIRVEAGYEGNLVSFTGEILSVFREDPGPDGKTVIMGQLGTFSNWITAQVDVDEEPGAKLEDILKKITKALDFPNDPIIPKKYASLTLPGKFTENGLASDVVKKLCSQFEGRSLNVIEDNQTLYLFGMEKPLEGTKTITLDYLKSAPQQNVGDGDGSYWQVFTAPWDPRVQPGTIVILPAWQYINNFTVVNAKNEKAACIVQSVSIHFGTCSSVNQMQISGLGAEI